MTRLRAFRIAQLGAAAVWGTLAGVCFFLMIAGVAQRPVVEVPEIRYTAAGVLLLAGVGSLAFLRTAGRFSKWFEEHSPEMRFSRRVLGRAERGSTHYPVWVHTAVVGLFGLIGMTFGMLLLLGLL